MWYMHDVGWGWWLLMSLGMVAFWGLIIYGVVWLLRGTSSGALGGPTPESPEQVLKRRLAAGEISVGEYERLQGVIDDDPRPAAPEPGSLSAPG
jgi:putative membrane protein